jgi:hypothetical protein
MQPVTDSPFEFFTCPQCGEILTEVGVATLPKACTINAPLRAKEQKTWRFRQHHSDPLFHPQMGFREVENYFKRKHNA